MKQKTLKKNCEHGCGMTVDWMVCDDDGENCWIAYTVQCGLCGRLNRERPTPKQTSHSVDADGHCNLGCC